MILLYLTGWITKYHHFCLQNASVFFFHISVTQYYKPRPYFTTKILKYIESCPYSPALSNFPPSPSCVSYTYLLTSRSCLKPPLFLLYQLQYQVLQAFRSRNCLKQTFSSPVSTSLSYLWTFVKAVFCNSLHWILPSPSRSSPRTKRALSLLFIKKDVSWAQAQCQAHNEYLVNIYWINVSLPSTKVSLTTSSYIHIRIH